MPTGGTIQPIKPATDKAYIKPQKVSKMDLRKLLASTQRQNIIKTLSEHHQMQIMRLVNATGTTYNELNRNLTILEKEGIIINEYPVKVRHGKVRVIRLNKENPKTQVLLKVIKTLDQPINAEKAPNKQR
jgi:predicted transcriptional regulator